MEKTQRGLTWLLVAGLCWTAVVLMLFCTNANADNDVTNSNNTNQNETTQTIYEDNSGQTHQNNATTETNDSSIGDNRNNATTEDSYNGSNRNNQFNFTDQDINNSVTKTVDTGGGHFVDGTGNNIGTNAGGGAITTSSTVGNTSANSNQGQSQQQGQQQAQGQNVKVGPNSTVFSPQQYIKYPVNTPNLSSFALTVANNANTCFKPAGGSATGGNGAVSGGLSLMFNTNDDNCMMWQQVAWLMAANKPIAACMLIMDFDKDVNEGRFAKVVESTGGCSQFVSAPVAASYTPSPVALDTQKRLDTLQPINQYFNAAHTNSMTK